MRNKKFENRDCECQIYGHIIRDILDNDHDHDRKRGRIFRTASSKIKIYPRT